MATQRYTNLSSIV